MKIKKTNKNKNKKQTKNKKKDIKFIYPLSRNYSIYRFEGNNELKILEYIIVII